MNAVSKFFSLAIALNSSVAFSSAAKPWWHIPAHWPLNQPLVALDEQVRRGWQVLSCGPGAAAQLWLPNSHDSLLPALRSLADWPQHQLARFAPCFELRLYQPEEVSCALAGERQRLQCDLPLQVAELQQIQIVYAEQGIASAEGAHQVNLPLNTSLNVLAHELGHLYGLADEYPLNGQIAANYCSGRYDHPSLNVVVTANDQLSSVELKALWQRLPWQFAVADWRQLGQPLANDQWQLGSAANQIGLYAIESCDAVGKFAWRPVDYLTAMHYVDVYAWPELYLQLIERQLAERELNPLAR